MLENIIAFMFGLSLTAFFGSYIYAFTKHKMKSKTDYWVRWIPFYFVITEFIPYLFRGIRDERRRYMNLGEQERIHVAWSETRRLKIEADNKRAYETHLVNKEREEFAAEIVEDKSVIDKSRDSDFTRHVEE